MRNPLRHHARTLALALLVFAALPAFVYAVVHGAGNKDGRGPEWEPVERALAADAERRPNVVFIYTDDQEFRTFNGRYMPRTVRLLGDGGTTFSNAVVATPICCPSRASMITGSYPHNSGVWMNKNGWSELRDKQNNLGTWMQRAGYRTAWIGKFLQGYKQAVPDPAVPAPGFDEWTISLKPKFFEYKLFSDGRKIQGTTRPRDYYTDVLTRHALSRIREGSDEPRPLFMLLNHLAPHRGEGGEGRCAGNVAPAPGDFGRFDDEPLPSPPSFNRVDRDKRAFGPRERLDRQTVEQTLMRHRCRVESLAAVDRSTARIAAELEREGELDNTIIVFTSDNGLLLGEHGLTGKGIPYEEGLRVPLAIRVPQRLLDGEQVASVDRLVANVDLAPTLLDLVGADPCISRDSCRPLDGLSIVPLLEGREEAWPSDRAVLIEGGHREEGGCAYRGVRLEHEVLLRTSKQGADGSCKPDSPPEVYDLRDDPYQLHNLATGNGAAAMQRVARLEELLHRLERCKGTEGDPAPAATPCT